jgi:hypothetical protein
MNKLYTLVFLCLLTAYTSAQTKPTQAFGKIDIADMQLKNCDFEKDANAEVLFDKGTVSLTVSNELIFERHIRIKIFNNKAKDEANIRIKFWGGRQIEMLGSLQAETINLNNGNIEFTRVDKKLIYNKIIDKSRSETVFAFPNVQPGSVIEYKYAITSKSVANFPDWYFQNDIPTRYSEFNTDLPTLLHYKTLQMITLPLIVNTEQTKAMANIPSLREEPFMSSKRDNAERMYYELSGIDGIFQNFSNSWSILGEEELGFDDFGGQFKRKLAGEDIILAKVKNLKSDDDKIASIFNEVKNTMKWDNNDERYTNDGTVTAWEKKIGNSTEINLILYHLLTKAGIKAYPMLVSTRNNGKVNPAYPSRYQFNKTVAYIPVDSSICYVLDATNKYANHKIIPADLLNSYGFYIDKDNKKYELIMIQNKKPLRQTVLIDAEIKADGKMSGTAQLIGNDYDRVKAVERYKIDGEKKYIDYLREDDNNLKISSIKFENIDVDSVSLLQNITFDLDLAGSDGNYIYFNTNKLSSLHNNPFLSEARTTDVALDYLKSYLIKGTYKIPQGFKIDALPKNITLTMPDNSISFRRIIGEQNGAFVAMYTINYKSTLFFKEDYANLHEFYKKMYELLNEQVVLKKS